MCLNVAGDEHKGQQGSSPNQRFRFCSDGRTSYVVLQFDSSVPPFDTLSNYFSNIIMHADICYLINWETKTKTKGA